MVRTSVRLLIAAAVAVAPLPAQTPSPAAPAPVTSAVTFGVDEALDVVSYQIQDLSDDGRWLAATSGIRRDQIGVDYNRQFGDPTYVAPAALRLWVIDTRTGESRAVFPDKRNVRGISWSPDGSRLAMLLVGADGTQQPLLWDRATGRTTNIPVPAGRYVSEFSEPTWTRDGKSVLLSLRPGSWRREARAEFERIVTGPIIVQTSTDPFLAWDGLRLRANRRSVVAYDLDTRRVRDVLTEGKYTNFALTEDGRALTFTEDVTKKTDYDVIFGTETRLRALTVGGTDTARVVVPSLRNMSLVWTRDGRRFAYAREGKLHVGTIDDTTRRQIAGDTARGPADTTKAGRERAARERFTPVRWSARGDALIASNRDGLWIIDPATKGRELMLATDTLPTSPRVAVFGWSDDGRYVYLTQFSRTAWDRAIVRYDRQAKRVEDIVRDGRLYGTPRVSRDGRVAVVSISEEGRPADLHAFALDTKDSRRLTNANPALAARVGRTELIHYLDADGHQKYGVVHYPVNYQRGTRYPTVFIIYEEQFDNSFDAVANMLNAAGYVVVKPSVDFDIGYPGEAWVKGVTSAANKLIEMGIADSARMGVHGTSYGGYATNLLITQTPRFKAAINISGKVDLISFYTDSPRLGVRNVHAAEKSQDRIGATLWEQPQKYVAHSAVFFADRIKTPLLLLTGEQDHNVPAGNTREMFYALRRLGKEVQWVSYSQGGHGVPMNSLRDFTDFHRRILAWYDEKLRAPALKVDVSSDGAR
jgi:dipeptidyl aminopeptidase/acylaminoacyl peptidase